MNITEIARRANVSTATVSRTLNQSGPVKAATARKVWRAVTEMNYYPNSHARALVSGRSRLIGLIVSDITNPFFPELIRAFQDLAAQKQYEVLLTSTDYLTSRMTECLRRMLERKVDGVAMMTSEMDLGLIKELSRRNVPIVFMDVGQMGPRMSHVAIDYGNGIRQAVDHVAGLGHRHIAFISGPLDLHSARTRRQAFLDGLRHHGLTPDRKLIREGMHTAEGGEQAMSGLLRLEAPDGRRVLERLDRNRRASRGARGRIACTGRHLDRWLRRYPASAGTPTRLTTVRMTASDVGATAFNALFRLIGEEAVEGDVYQIPTKLVVRESTSRPKRK